MGVFYCNEDGSTYEGGFLNGRKDARGTLTFRSGHFIDGVWQHGLLIKINNFSLSPNSPWNNPDL